MQWLPGWSEDQSILVQDAIALSLWIREPLYRTATESVRGLMEMEEATSLLNMIDTAGRGHGWIRKHLEEDLRARGGGAPAVTNFWDLARSQKRAAQLVDYISTVRGFRIGLWWPEMRAVTNIPLLPSIPTLILVNCETCRVLIGPSGFELPDSSWDSTLVLSDMTWFVPPSAPSCGATTVGQITEELESFRPGPHKGNRNQLWRALQYEKACKTAQK